jgi:hypothetical protein
LIHSLVLLGYRGRSSSIIMQTLENNTNADILMDRAAHPPHGESLETGNVVPATSTGDIDSLSYVGPSVGVPDAIVYS